MNIKQNLHGIFPALLTPFHKDESINANALSDLVERNLSFGVNGFYVGGSTGEGMVMSDDERVKVFEIVAKANKGRVPLIAHVGSIRTQSAIDMGKQAKALGYDAISAVAPFYYSFKKDDILNYYRDIARETDMPMVIYNFPLSGSFSLNRETADELLQDARFVGIKHTVSDLFALQQFKTLPSKPVVFNGYDEMLLGGLAMGADGGIGSTYNVMPQKFTALYKAFRLGDMATAQSLQNEINAAIAAMIPFGVFQCEKYLLTLLHVDAGDCRRPFGKLTDAQKDAIEQTVLPLVK